MPDQGQRGASKEVNVYPKRPGLDICDFVTYPARAECVDGSKTGRMMDAQNHRVPVTLLTGFLGAGKTTLLNRLVSDPDAGRIAVIINEFGDVGLDHDLIETATNETILMQSGCLCCSIRGDLARTVVSLLARRSRGELEFDRIVIETTGIADPGPILHTLVVDQILGPHVRLDGVVTCADAATGPLTLDAHFEAVQQIAMADLIVLTKTDLVAPDALDRFQARLDGINATAPRITADKGRVPVEALFGLTAMRDGATADELTTWLSAPAPDPLAGLSGFAAPDGSTTSATAPAHHHNDDRIASASITLEEPISDTVFDLWLDTLVASKGSNLLRVKGIVHLEDMVVPFVFHGVQHIFDMPKPFKNWTGSDKISRVVVIARDMTKAELETSLATLRMRPQEPDESQTP